MKSTPKSERRSGPIFLCQLFFSALIMLGMGTYVWMIQLQYDEAAKATVWHGRIRMPIFYALTVAAAGFSYDCAKSIIFLTETVFKKFLVYLRDAFISCIVVVVAMVSATYLLSLDQPGARFAGQTIYLVGLAFVWWAIQSVSDVLNVAAGGDQQSLVSAKAK